VRRAFIANPGAGEPAASVDPSVRDSTARAASTIVVEPILEVGFPLRCSAFGGDGRRITPL
jgi:hypothetical protein